MDGRTDDIKNKTNLGQRVKDSCINVRFDKAKSKSNLPNKEFKVIAIEVLTRFKSR